MYKKEDRKGGGEEGGTTVSQSCQTVQYKYVPVRYNCSNMKEETKMTTLGSRQC